jgi:hypothetical protein
MKKLFGLSFVCASLLYAGNWSLKGAVSNLDVTSDIQTTTGCVRTVWTYDDNGTWSLYQTIDDSTNYGLNQLTIIKQGAGYWVNSTCPTTESDSDNTSGLDQYLITSDTTTATISDLQTAGTFFDIWDEGDGFGKFVVSNNTDIILTDYDYNGSSWETEEEESGTMSNINGSYARVTFSDGGVYDINILKTAELTDINSTSIDDTLKTDILSMSIKISDVNITVVTPGPAETDVWDWDNPSYWDGSSEIPVTDLDSLADMFTTSNDCLNASENPVMLVSNGTVVKGTYVGNTNGYDEYNRTSTVVGSWENNDTHIVVTIPTDIIGLRVINESNTYKIESSWQDVQGAVFQEKFITGTDLNETTMQKFLLSF